MPWLAWHRPNLNILPADIAVDDVLGIGRHGLSPVDAAPLQHRPHLLCRYMPARQQVRLLAMLWAGRQDGTSTRRAVTMCCVVFLLGRVPTLWRAFASAHSACNANEKRTFTCSPCDRHRAPSLSVASTAGPAGSAGLRRPSGGAPCCRTARALQQSPRGQGPATGFRCAVCRRPRSRLSVWAVAGASWLPSVRVEPKGRLPPAIRHAQQVLNGAAQALKATTP